ncbi:Rha family transcriptional regulator [Helicobacter mesocricetorum]|uniref:Rha family transcriptional regulator n=1 Tax=Helicobacter mesocricetorum TaxID=87012 RepID=UPI000CF0216E|nr:Rha family transcriptional regulator [Helicobacter mesocricetorum]
MKPIIINQQEVQFTTSNHQIFCTSLDIARVFGKRHDDILKAIRNIVRDLREIGDLQCIRNFAESYEYRKIEGFKGVTKYPFYNLTRDGFSLLAMGFTGKKALQWKIAFLNAFNQMEQNLKQEIRSPNPYLTDLMKLIYPNLPKEDYRIDINITQSLNPQEAQRIFTLNYLVDNRNQIKRS